LRINRGGEFTLGTCNEFCKQHGICRQLTQSHTHQNEVIKRKNKLLTKRAKNIALENWLPFYFWTKVINIMAFLLNHSLTKASPNATLEETFLGKQPNLRI